MTDLAHLKALAEAARDARIVYESSDDPALRFAGVTAAEGKFTAACSPSTILALIAQAEPAGGEFGERLQQLAALSAEARSLAVIADELRFQPTADEAERRCEERDALIAALSRTHAAVVAERDAARASLTPIIDAFKERNEGALVVALRAALGVAP